MGFMNGNPRGSVVIFDFDYKKTVYYKCVYYLDAMRPTHERYVKELRKAKALARKWEKEDA
jgi:hypothetical protein